MATGSIREGIVQGEDGRNRCWWGASHTDYIAYHDREWGRPVRDDRRLFEKICLEGFQSGLSWLTILRKRENFRAAFADFDFERVSRFNRRSVDRLLRDAGIVRHRGKIESAIHNAKLACDLCDEAGSLAAYFWSFEPGGDDRPARFDRETLASWSESATSRAISKDLKRRGFSYVGPTTVYAFMQAMGLVNDHVEGCEAREVCESARERFRRPRRKSR